MLLCGNGSICENCGTCYSEVMVESIKVVAHVTVW